ncbi:hypothetical protein [Herbidospora mongoliensis]|uniref:hypothetical protein n=1 Tax=Herbidospora mongoliensis TaxID=688067 RepID=UPI000B118E32|nr:hypothetical protein [Herbidospora mongoliensis]
MTRITLAVGLFFLAPLMGEYLIGNVPTSQLPGILILAPMYGGAALLIREVTRSTGRGWPTMLTLAAAYGLLQPAIIDQSLFNPAFDGHDFTAAPTYLPALGLDPGLLITFTAGHTITSLAVPIALMEALARRRATTPWLRTPGLIVTITLFAAGTWLIYDEHQRSFQATPLQLGISAVVVLLLAAAAFRFPRTPHAVALVSGDGSHNATSAATNRAASRPASLAHRPRPWQAGLAAALAVTLYTLRPETWPGLILGVLLLTAAATLIAHWSHHPGWSRRHITCLAAGAAVTPLWTGFVLLDITGQATPPHLIGQAAVVTVVIAVLTAAVRAAR